MGSKSEKIRTLEENQKRLQNSEVFLLFQKIWPPWLNAQWLWTIGIHDIQGFHIRQ